ncbi:hypothetical protein O0R52_21920 (plasmid) [Bacillus halotolerans]|uniref:Uncharacterized protein n=1 Tax=Bacillus halotolerans TaxID=260554 RepID=A0ABY7I6Q5_9BACI|nr:hypothetical protein [Bacillus halotolerans]WAT23657.1 hypothetical protein O0R52_21920 [Bacillus halotolerans]
MYGNEFVVNQSLSQYATKLLKMYLKFPENQKITALDWNARDGEFLNTLTKNATERFLYGVSDSKYNCDQMREEGFHKVSESHYRSEAKITNDIFSLMVVNPQIDSRIIDELFQTMDPYKMPNFREEVQDMVMRQEEEKQYLKDQMKQQIDFGELEDKQSIKAIAEESEEEKQERINKQINTELQKRVKAWRMAIKEQQKKMQSMRFDGFLLQRATTYLRPGGILVMVTLKDLIDETISFKLVNQYENIKIIRLEDDEFLQSRKCIILAKKRVKPTREEYELAKAIARTKERPYDSFGKIREITASLEDEPEKYNKQKFRAKVDAIYEVIEPQVEPSYVVPESDPEDITSFRVGPITGSEALITMKKSKLIDTYREKYSQVLSNKEPVTPTPLHKGHIMLLLTSGFLNGYIGTGPDQHLVKGSAIKDVREFSETDDEGNLKVVEREYYNIGVKLLNGQGQFRKIM